MAILLFWMNDHLCDLTAQIIGNSKKFLLFVFVCSMRILIKE